MGADDSPRSAGQALADSTLSKDWSLDSFVGNKDLKGGGGGSAVLRFSFLAVDLDTDLQNEQRGTDANCFAW
jgi:hypothetical protein